MTSALNFKKGTIDFIKHFTKELNEWPMNR